MSELVGINLGDALPYLEDKIRALFGRDAESLHARELLRRQTAFAIRDCGSMQIVGMDRAVAISDIYQPTRLLRQWRNETVTVDDLLTFPKSAVVFGRPGAGKTALLHYVFLALSATKSRLPVLFTLRRADDTENLATFVSLLAKGKVSVASGTKLVLLVDGYDEISIAQRRNVTNVLQRFQTLEVGEFILTCRSYYPIDDTGADHLDIQPFSASDAQSFVTSFAKAYGVSLNAPALIKELTGRGFEDFLRHPLMLTLACILKAGPLPELPRTVTGLLRRAVDTLTFRWDEAKGVARDTMLAIDGDDRVRCMMHIAFSMNSYEASDQLVMSSAREYLRLLQRPHVDAAKLLQEIAQWYGMLVPVPGDVWAFAHRTVHDYLAARQWVDTGMFQSSRVREWNVRAAYAASLIPDATSAIIRMLHASADTAPFVECLYNNARFDVDRVASAICKHFDTFRGFSLRIEPGAIVVRTSNDFFGLLSDDLLAACLREAVQRPTSDAYRFVAVLALVEMKRRDLAPPADLRQTAFTRVGRIEHVSVIRGDSSISFKLGELIPNRGA